jgi:Family of unknown function (DUF5320)
MPGRDGKGPQGAGPGTGGRRGSCFAGTGPVAGATNLRGAGQGYAPRGGGRGRAFGGGRGPGFGTQAQAEDSAQALKERAAALERELEEVRRRMKDCTEQG